MKYDFPCALKQMVALILHPAAGREVNSSYCHRSITVAIISRMDDRMTVLGPGIFWHWYWPLKLFFYFGNKEKLPIQETDGKHVSEF